MSMLVLAGQVMNVLETPKGVSRKTGEEYGGYHQVQILCEEELQNGETRMQLQTLTTDHPEAFKPLKGRAVRVPVGVYVYKGAISFFIPKGSKPEALQPSQGAD
jgi:hypothetical protein